MLSLPLFFEGVYTRIFSGMDGGGESIIGLVLQPKNDVRLKTKNSLGWETLRASESKLRLGSSIFSGAGSETTIRLDQGLTIKLMIKMKENSLIKFNRVGDFMIPEIAFGSFELSSTGGIQVMKDGQIYAIQNTSGGNVHLFADASGIKAFDDQGRPITLFTPGQSMAQIPVGSTPSPIKAMDLLPADQVVQMDARLDDFYLADAAYDGSYWRKSGPEIKRQLYFSWQTSVAPMKQKVQHATNPEMREAKTYLTQSQNQVLVERLFIGSNFWRVMPDETAWSETRHFEVQLKTFATSLRLTTKHQSPWLTLVPTRLQLQVSGTTHPDLAGTLIEISRQGDVLAQDRAFLFAPGQPIVVPLDETGTYSIRAREVLNNRLISGASSALRLDVVRPALPDAPEFLGPAVKLGLSQLTQIEWTMPTKAKQFDLEIHNLTTGEKQTRSVQDNKLGFQSDSAGTFNVRVRARDHYGQRSAWSLSKEVEVMAPLSAPPALAQNIENDFNTRAKLPFSKPRPIFYNDNYDSDALSSEVSGYVMTSSEQKILSREVALGSILGLRIRKNFFQQQAAEAHIRIKTISFNETAPSSLYSADVRYFYRLQTDWIKAWKWRPFFSLGVGAEMLRSQNEKIFSPAYDLAKLGFRVNFPYLRSWTMGGDVFFGQATDSSTKLEVAGHFGYFFDHRFSAGLGYRVYYFEAATAASTPQGLPFREAFGEGYSVFRYHF